MPYSNDNFSEFPKKITTVNEILKNYERSVETVAEIVEHCQKSLSKVQLPCEEIFATLKQLNYTNALSSLSETSTSVTLEKNMLSEQYKVLNEKISSSFTESLSNLSAISFQVLDDSFDLANNISFTNNDVMVSDDALTSISSAIDVPTECIRHRNSKEHFVQISVKDFLICILYPLLLAILPMLRSDYLNSRNALEAEKESLKTESYQERALQLDQDILNTNEQINFYLKQISDALNNLQESQPPPCEKEDCFPLHPSDFHSDKESDAVDDNVLDESSTFDNPD